MIGPVASMIKFKKEMTYEDFLNDPFQKKKLEKQLKINEEKMARHRKKMEKKMQEDLERD